MVKKKFITIALDGGAASGKSSTAKILAKQLNLLHVDTGAHYRTIAFMLLKNNVYPSNHILVIDTLKNFRINDKIEDRDVQMTINGVLPDQNDLRSPSVNQYVSSFSAIPELRQFLLQYQQSQVELAAKNGFDGLIMDGRDIGSVVLPDANFKFFLEADPDTRHSRRVLQGHQDSIVARDQLDSSRATAPMVCASDAVRIDTSHFTLEEVANHILSIILNNK